MKRIKKVLTYRTSCKFRVRYELEFLEPLKINNNSSCVKKKKGSTMLQQSKKVIKPLMDL